MRRMILTTTALVSLSVGLASAEVVADGIVQSLQTQGYTAIEVLIGPTQLKVEAYQPGTKIEAIHDLATGAVLKMETVALEADDDQDFAPKLEIEDVKQDFLDSNGRPISDDEAFNDPFANLVTNDLLALGFTEVETLIGPTQVRARAAMATGERIEIIYDRATGAVLRETAFLTPEDDDYAPGTLIEDVAYDFLDAEGNDIDPNADEADDEDEEQVEEEEDEEQEEEEEEADDDDDRDDESPEEEDDRGDDDDDTDDDRERDDHDDDDDDDHDRERGDDGDRGDDNDRGDDD